jgi:hypothetical protein
MTILLLFGLALLANKLVSLRQEDEVYNMGSSKSSAFGCTSHTSPYIWGCLETKAETDCTKCQNAQMYNLWGL